MQETVSLIYAGLAQACRRGSITSHTDVRRAFVEESSKNKVLSPDRLIKLRCAQHDSRKRFLESLVTRRSLTVPFSHIRNGNVNVVDQPGRWFFVFVVVVVVWCCRCQPDSAIMPGACRLSNGMRTCWNSKHTI